MHVICDDIKGFSFYFAFNEHEHGMFTFSARKKKETLFLVFGPVISKELNRIVICVNSFQHKHTHTKQNVVTMSTTLHMFINIRVSFNTNKQQNNQLKSSICPNSELKCTVLNWNKGDVCIRLISFLLNYCNTLCSKRSRNKKNPSDFQFYTHNSTKRIVTRALLLFSVSVLRLKISHMQPSSKLNIREKRSIHHIQLQTSDFIRKIA